MAGASGTAVQSTAEENSAAAGTGTVDASVSKIILIFLKIHQISQYERWFGLRAGDAAPASSSLSGRCVQKKNLWVSLINIINWCLFS